MTALITAALLRAVAPGLSQDRAELLAPPLQEAAARYGITTPARVAAFIAQTGEESDGFRTLEEYASGAEYEGRRDLGNIQPGDGKRFKGRGPIQITGRTNYWRAGLALGLDLVEHPELLTQPGPGCLASGWFWDAHRLNDLADQGTHASFLAMTRIINGGTRGLEVRRLYWARAKRFLGVEDPPGELLMMGSAGERVAQLQRDLAAQGFNVGPADGVFGTGTEAAVKALQAGCGLPVDGIAGPRTLAMLSA